MSVAGNEGKTGSVSLLAIGQPGGTDSDPSEAAAPTPAHDTRTLEKSPKDRSGRGFTAPDVS